MMRRLLLRGALAARCMCVVQQPCVRALPLSVWLPCCLSYSTTPLLLQRDDKHNDMSSFAAPAHSTVGDVPAELYTKTMMSLQLDKSCPALENKLYDYVAHYLGDNVAAKVMRDCTVAQYTRQPATCCADAQARQRIDALADIQPARELLRMFNAGYATVGAWAKAGMPTNVAGVSAATYSYLSSMVDAARAPPQVTHPARNVVARDEYGQAVPCEQLLSADVGRALYDSVYKATWGALQYTAVGVHVKTSRAADDVVLPIVPCGTWPDTLIMDDSSVAAARRKSTAPDVLTLYSPLGWPAMWKLGKLPKRAPSSDEVARRVTAASAAQQLAPGTDDYKSTLFVRGEVQRAWRCIERTRDEAQPLRQGSATTQGTTTAAAAALAQARGEQHSNVAQSQAAQGSVVSSQSSTSSNTVATMNQKAFIIVRGTPGIGKTLSIGGYVLYKLLHEEGERALPYVLFEVDDLSFVFDKRNATVACYERASFSALMFALAVDGQYARIFDCSKTRVYAREETKKGAKLNIIITSPNTSNIHEVRTKDIDLALLTFAVVHAWSLREMLLVGRYLGIDEATVRDRVTKVGPLPRFVFDYKQVKFERRVKDIGDALHSDAVQRVDMPLCSIQVDALYNKENPTNKVFDLRRAADDPDDTTTQDETKTAAAASYSSELNSSFCYIPLSRYAKDALIQVMRERQRKNELYFGGLLCSCIDYPKIFEHAVIQLFAMQAMWAYIAGADNDGMRRCTYMPRGGDGAAADEPDTPLRHNTLCEWVSRMPERKVINFDDRATITFDTRDGMRVFVPRSRAFPLVDAFVLLYYAERVHYIGIQVTDSDSHRPTADNVRSFYERHPKIVVAGADGLTPQQPALMRVTPPTVQVSTRVDSPAMQEASVDVLNRKVLGNVNGTRSMLYVKKYDDDNVSYQQLQSATDVPEDVARNWHTYAQYCCKVRDRYW